MKRFLSLSAAVLAVSFAMTTPASAQVGVSVQIGDPNFYGSLVLGNGMQPVLINPAPIYSPGYPRAAQMAPIYLRVPAYQRQHWGRYCRQYNACGVPVFFVQDTWYNNVYAPYYRGRPEYRGEYRNHGEHRGDYRGEHRGDYRGVPQVAPQVVPQGGYRGERHEQRYEQRNEQRHDHREGYQR